MQETSCQGAGKNPAYQLGWVVAEASQDVPRGHVGLSNHSSFQLRRSAGANVIHEGLDLQTDPVHGDQ